MITETGENLNVVIQTQTGEDWRAFATWYSVNKNLPDASVSLLCHRSTRVEFQFYQWAKRLNVPIRFINPFYYEKIGDQLHDIKVSLNDRLLLVDQTVIFTDMLDTTWLEIMNSNEPILMLDEHCALSRLISTEAIDHVINNYAFTGSIVSPGVCVKIIPEAKDTEEPIPIVSYSKGCGRWIDTMRGCPFSNADGLLVEGMTVNEMRIVQLWRKMVALFSAVN